VIFAKNGKISENLSCMQKTF